MKARAVLIGLVSTMLVTSSSHSNAENGTKVFQALLEGYQETPAVSSTGSGAHGGSIILWG